MNDLVQGGHINKDRLIYFAQSASQERPRD